MPISGTKTFRGFYNRIVIFNASSLVVTGGTNLVGLNHTFFESTANRFQNSEKKYDKTHPVRWFDMFRSFAEVRLLKMEASTIDRIQRRQERQDILQQRRFKRRRFIHSLRRAQ